MICALVMCVIPQSVWCTTKTARISASVRSATMLRMASAVARPPALRMAPSPRSDPTWKKFSGTQRGRGRSLYCVCLAVFWGRWVTAEDWRRTNQSCTLALFGNVAQLCHHHRILPCFGKFSVAGKQILKLGIDYRRHCGLRVSYNIQRECLTVTGSSRGACISQAERK